MPSSPQILEDCGAQTLDGWCSQSLGQQKKAGGFTAFIPLSISHHAYILQKHQYETDGILCSLRLLRIVIIWSREESWSFPLSVSDNHTHRCSCEVVRSASTLMTSNRVGLLDDDRAVKKEKRGTQTVERDLPCAGICNDRNNWACIYLKSLIYRCCVHYFCRYIWMQ